MSKGFASMEGTERLREITQAAGRKSAQMRYGEKLGAFHHACYYNGKCGKGNCHCHRDGKGHGPYWIIYKYHNGKRYALSAGKNEPTDWTPFEEKLMQKIARINP